MFWKLKRKYRSLKFKFKYKFSKKFRQEVERKFMSWKLNSMYGKFGEYRGNRDVNSLYPNFVPEGKGKWDSESKVK